MRPDLMMPQDPAVQAAQSLSALASLEGSAELFWPLYLQAVGQALGARRVFLLSSAVGRPWQARGQWPEQGADQPQDASWTLQLLAQAQGSQVHAERDAQGAWSLVMQPTGLSSNDAQVLALVALELQDKQWDGNGLRAWARLAAGIPVQFMQHSLMRAKWLDAQSRSSAEPVSSDAQPAPVSPSPKAERLHDILRLAIELGHLPEFMQVAMALCNALAERYGCDRVSLGWVQGHYVHLRAVSHVENFDAKSAASRALEAAMEEAMEQDAALVYPLALANSPWVLHFHRAYAEMVGVTHMSSVPLTHADAVCAVLSLERQSGALTESELWELQMLGELLGGPLVQRHGQQLWWGTRAWQAVQAQARDFWGPRHTAWKLAGAGSAALVVLLTVLPWPYRVDATLAVRSQDLLFMPAPFDGYLRTVHVKIGDQVNEGDVLVELDTRDLQLEASMAEADQVRYASETEKALAARQLADMQIAFARQQQAEAHLELIRYQLQHAQVRAPYAGVVIEGELKKNLGAPVRKGDLLLKLAQTRETYLELEIDQAYVHEVSVGMRGEFALVGRPEERYEITVSRIDPAAVNRDGKTFYLARAELLGQQRPDWRPGMGGNAKLQAGYRSLIWVLTHRTVRFLREFFWI